MLRSQTRRRELLRTTTAIATVCLSVLARPQRLFLRHWTPVRRGPVQPTVVIIGDSLSTGHGTSPADAWPNLVENDPGFQQFQATIVNAAHDGSGYVSVGDDGSTFGSQVDTAVTDETRLVLFFGSENDMGTAPGETEAAAARAFASVKARAPASRHRGGRAAVVHEHARGGKARHPRPGQSRCPESRRRLR